MKSSSESISESSSINGCMDDSTAVDNSKDTFGITTFLLSFILESFALLESNYVTLSDKLDIVCFKSLTSLCMWLVFSATPPLQYLHAHT